MSRDSPTPHPEKAPFPDGSFTPGPWRIATTGNFGNVIEADSGKRSHEFDNGYRTVAMFQACTSARRHDEEQANALANGRLIAAAPDMFDALHAARDTIRQLYSMRGCEAEGEFEEWVDFIDAALSKATGGQHV